MQDGFRVGEGEERETESGPPAHPLPTMSGSGRCWVLGKSGTWRWVHLPLLGPFWLWPPGAFARAALRLLSATASATFGPPHAHGVVVGRSCRIAPAWGLSSCSQKCPSSSDRTHRQVLLFPGTQHRSLPLIMGRGWIGPSFSVSPSLPPPLPHESPHTYSMAPQFTPAPSPCIGSSTGCMPASVVDAAGRFPLRIRASALVHR